MSSVRNRLNKTLATEMAEELNSENPEGEQKQK